MWLSFDYKISLETPSHLLSLSVKFVVKFWESKSNMPRWLDPPTNPLTEEALTIPLPKTPRKCRACQVPIKEHPGPFGMYKCRNNPQLVTDRIDASEEYRRRLRPRA